MATGGDYFFSSSGTAASANPYWANYSAVTDTFSYPQCGHVFTNSAYPTGARPASCPICTQQQHTLNQAMFQQNQAWQMQMTGIQAAENQALKNQLQQMKERVAAQMLGYPAPGEKPPTAMAWLDSEVGAVCDLAYA